MCGYLSASLILGMIMCVIYSPQAHGSVALITNPLLQVRQQDGELHEAQLLGQVGPGVGDGDGGMTRSTADSNNKE